MADNRCPHCDRPKHESLIAGQHMCDMVRLADGRSVHASRVAPGGDLESARVAERNITEEMRNLQRKGML